jgi:hypothetical protein
MGLGCISSHGCPEKLDPVSCLSFSKGLDLFWLSCPPKERQSSFRVKSMPVPMRSGSRDFSKRNIRWLRVERKEIKFSSASPEMAGLILVRPKGPPANLRYSSAFPSATKSPAHYCGICRSTSTLIKETVTVNKTGTCRMQARRAI